MGDKLVMIRTSCTLVVLAWYFFCSAAQADPETKETGPGLCSDEEHQAVKSVVSGIPGIAHCERLKSKRGDGKLTYADLIYMHSKRKRNAGLILMTAVAPVFIGLDIWAIVSLHRARVRNDRSEEKSGESYWRVNELFYGAGVALSSVIASMTLIWGLILTVTGTERMRAPEFRRDDYSTLEYSMIS